MQERKIPFRQKLPSKQYNLPSNYKKNSIIKFYVVSTSTTFNIRYRNHKASINNKFKVHNTELSNNLIWELKDANKDYN